MRYLVIFFFFLCFSCSKPDESTITFDYCADVQRNDSLSLDAELVELAPMMENKTGVYVLEDGDGAMITRAWLTEYSQLSIDIQYFIFSMDNIGLIALDYLVRAADRGVKVRMLIDDLMVDAEIEDVLMLNSHENIDIRIYNPGMNLGKNIFQKLKKAATDFRSTNQRMHNKTFIVDEKVVITGGRNIADEYFDYDHEYNFRDRDVLLLGKATSQVNESFEDFWSSDLSVNISELADAKDEKHIDPSRFELLHQYACNPNNFWPQIRTKIKELPETFHRIKQTNALAWVDDVQFVSDVPGKNSGEEGLGGGGLSTDALIELIKNAESSLDIQTPYLITTDLSRNLFKEAVKRGVTIRILTNSLASTDNVEAFSGYQRDREILLETGVRIYEFRPDAEERRVIMTGALQEKLDYTPTFGLHAKSMVIDGRITVIGTFNLDPRSANLNTECIAIIDSEEISSKVLAGMEIEFLPENSWETTSEFNPDDVAGNMKQIKTWSRKVIPKDIL